MQLKPPKYYRIQALRPLNLLIVRPRRLLFSLTLPRVPNRSFVLRKQHPVLAMFPVHLGPLGVLQNVYLQKLSPAPLACLLLKMLHHRLRAENTSRTRHSILIIYLIAASLLCLKQLTHQQSHAENFWCRIRRLRRIRRLETAMTDWRGRSSCETVLCLLSRLFPT